MANYGAIPPAGGGGAGYAKPPTYEAPYQQPNQPLHQPVNNSFGNVQYQQDPPPQPAFNPGYAPAPPVMAPAQQQQSNTNVVVVNQPQPTQPIVQVSRPPQAPSYLILAAVLMVVCLLHGNFPTLTCLIPALIFAYVAEEHNRNGEYQEAKRCGFFALCCSISSIMYFVLIIIAVIVFIILVFAVGIFNNVDPDPYPPQ